MLLKSFRAKNFRSIKDSGEVHVSRITSIIGRNESGKSNLLKVLHSLNPVGGIKDLKAIEDFPRDKKLNECNEYTYVLGTTWTLTEYEQSELEKIFPRAVKISEVTIDRRYSLESGYNVRFKDLPALVTVNFKTIQSNLAIILTAIEKIKDHVAENRLEEFNSTVYHYEKLVSKVEAWTSINWSEETITATTNLKKALLVSTISLSEDAEKLIEEIKGIAEGVIQDCEDQEEGAEWIIKRIPKFIYLEDYPQLQGRQNIADYNKRKDEGGSSKEDQYFEKLCKVSGLDPVELQRLAGDSATRNQLVNRAGAIVTDEIRRLWKDRSLKVRFNIDGNFLDTLISETTSGYDVEVNLNERSRGFQWFFAFYINFAADADKGIAENTILLLDEPGLYLHAKSQSDLLNHFRDDFKNQILYTTHSPFMVPTGDLDSIRTVNMDAKDGTTVTNDPSGDTRTLFPLQAALGYTIAQSLFVGQNNLVVEGITDYWILSSISEYLADKRNTGLNSDVTITPAGGAQKISYMVALLSSQDLNVVVLLDREKESETTTNDLIKSKLINERNVVFVTKAFGLNPPVEADIEDLLDPEIYKLLVLKSYEKEINGRELNLNKNIPRIAKRFEKALADLGIDFHKTRPARVLLTEMSNNVELVINKDTASRFEKLFERINTCFLKITEIGGKSLMPKL